MTRAALLAAVVILGVPMGYAACAAVSPADAELLAHLYDGLLVKAGIECHAYAVETVTRALAGTNHGPHARQDLMDEIEGGCFGANVGSARRVDDWLQTGQLTPRDVRVCAEAIAAGTFTDGGLWFSPAYATMRASPDAGGARQVNQNTRR